MVRSLLRPVGSMMPLPATLLLGLNFLGLCCHNFRCVDDELILWIHSTGKEPAICIWKEFGMQPCQFCIWDFITLLDICFCVASGYGIFYPSVIERVSFDLRGHCIGRGHMDLIFISKLDRMWTREFRVKNDFYRIWTHSRDQDLVSPDRR